MNKILTISTLSILIVFSGCKKEEPGLHKKSFFSKVKEKYSGKKKSKNLEAIKFADAFKVKDEDMKSFAFDSSASEDKESSAKSDSATPLETRSTTAKNNFPWEDQAAEKSKNEFERLFFEFDRYILKPKQEKKLKKNIKLAKKMIKKGKNIVIEGHACHSAGSAIYNLALSEKRARHVAKKMTNAGIDSKYIKIAPRGHEMPIVKGGNREAQAVNRRVEIFAIDR